jgi:Polysaccharide pyruvyl transferase
MSHGMRVLVTGWPSFRDGEATAGDVLAMEAVRRTLAAARIPCDLAWSPVFRPGGHTLAQASPGRYSHLVFCCGPLHGPQVAGLHRRYARCRRIAVGVSVIDPADPAVAGFHAILARDGAGADPRRDLAAGVGVPPVPVAGICLAPGQQEYGEQRRHDEVTAGLGAWLECQECARVPLDTRLDPRGWRNHATPSQVEAIIRRLDVVVTTRLHGLVLALKNGVPALAIDPVAGGAKVTAQALVWDWPAVITSDGRVAAGELDRQWRWCLSREAAERAAAARLAAYEGCAGTAPGLTADLLRLLDPPAAAAHPA